MGRYCAHGRSSTLSTTTTLLFILHLLTLEYVATACICNLTSETRQIRDDLLENQIREHISVYLANQTAFLKYETVPSFDLTSHLLNYTQENDTIDDFVLAGHLRGLNWWNLTKGFQGSNNSNVYRHTCSQTTCYGEWVNLTTYLKTECELYFKWHIPYYAWLYNYPFGTYRSWRPRYFNFTGIDNATNPMKPCFCTPSASFAYRFHFSINSTNLDRNVCNITTQLENSMQTDLELAVDQYASEVFGASYIQSNFDAWVFTSNCSAFNMTLYFMNYYDENWNTTSSDMENKLRNLTQFSLSYLDTEVDVFPPPKVIRCKWFANGQNGTCVSTTTTSTTILPTISTSIAFSSQFISSSTSSLATTNTAANETFSTWTTAPFSLSTLSLSASTNPTASTSNGSTHTFSSVSTVASLIMTSGSGLQGSTSNQLSPTMYNGISFMAYLNSNYSTTNSVTSSNSFLSNTSVIPSQGAGSSSMSASILSTEGISTGSIASVSTNNSQLTSDQNSLIVSTSTITSNTATNGFVETFLTTAAIVNATQGNRTVHASLSNSSTTFDSDPLFKAEVPVVTKIYNDRYLFRSKIEVRGTYVTSQPLFYSIAIPALLGILAAVILLIVLCQIDWIGKPKAPKPT